MGSCGMSNASLHKQNTSNQHWRQRMSTTIGQGRIHQKSLTKMSHPSTVPPQAGPMVGHAAKSARIKEDSEKMSTDDDSEKVLSLIADAIDVFGDSKDPLAVRTK